ncbi:hypothetical protein B9Z19DRAFT_1096468 [Tuber borchii]|uniref:Uncharacterized protein n=1 Tax=Tuber borchii TaxID=42251 RepID=A0A2T6ZBI8_TUBBO|nr:hypothetical protein B9Z19DRAFT_1096468 [Tuber borchii]
MMLLRYRTLYSVYGLLLLPPFWEYRWGNYVHWPRCGVSAFYLYHARTLFLFLCLISVLHPGWGSPGDVLSAFKDPLPLFISNALVLKLH